MSDPKRFGVIDGGTPKKPKDPKNPDNIKVLECLRCKRERGIGMIEWLELRQGGYIHKGRLVGFEKILVCAHCFRLDGHVETIGRLEFRKYKPPNR